MKPRLTHALAACLLLAGCAAVSSKQVDYAESTGTSGLQYSAPKALMTVEVLASARDVSIAVSQPFLVGDPDATFTMKSSSGMFADQRYDFRVDGVTRLLWIVRSESLGRLDEALIAAAKSYGGVISSGGGPREERSTVAGDEPALIYFRTIDPLMQEGCGFGQACRLSKLEAELKTVIQSRISCAAQASDGENPMCSPLRADRNPFSIELIPLFEVAAPGAAPARKAKPCRGSICYRVPVPYEMRVRVENVSDVSQMVLLPNEAPIFSYDVGAGLFSDSKAFIGLENGMPVRTRANRDNELAAAAAVPLSVTQALFQGASDVLTLRVKYTKELKGAVLADEELEKELKRIADAEEAARRAQARRTAPGADTDEEEEVDEGFGALPPGTPVEESGEVAGDAGSVDSLGVDDDGASEAEAPEDVIAATTRVLKPAAEPLLTVRIPAQ